MTTIMIRITTPPSISMIIANETREVMWESSQNVVTVDCWLIYSSHIVARYSTFVLVNRAEVEVKESPDDSDNNNRNYNDNDSDKNNYNVEIIRNCRSTIAIFSLLLLSLHGGLVKVYLLLLHAFSSATSSASHTGEQWISPVITSVSRLSSIYTHPVPTFGANSV